MSRISNDLASQISTKLTEKSRIASDKLHTEFRQLVTDFYENQIPEEVVKCFKKFPDWFYTRSTVKLHGHGFDWEYVTTTKPVICNSNSEAHMTMTAKIGDKLISAKRKWEKAKKEHAELKEESKQALLTLKTFNNIRKELPEAASMLPPPMSNALVVNFDSLKKRLNKQPEIIKEPVLN